MKYFTRVHHYGVLFSFFTFFFSNSQEIKVLDAATKEPLVEVAIYNKKGTSSAITDIFGKADLSSFEDNDLIYFQYLTHQLLLIPKREIVAAGLIVYLQPDTEKLSEIVISASKWSQQRKDVVQRVASVNRSDIALDNPQTSADLLESSGQVFVQKSQLGGGSPMIRGFSTNRLLITVDGVRMNNAIFRGGNVQNVISIDPLVINGTEVVLGAGSVIYGSDAIGGVMNFYSQKAIPSYYQQLETNGNALVRYSTANEEKTGHFDVNLGTNKWGFRTSVSYTFFDDLRMGNHGYGEYLRPSYVERIDGKDVIVPNSNPKIQVPTGYEQINLMQKVRLAANNRWDFSAGLLYSSTTTYPRYDRLIRPNGDEPRSAEWKYGPQRWLMGNIAIEQKQPMGAYNKMRIVTAYQNFQESRFDRDFRDSIRNITEENVDAISFNIDFEKTFTKKSTLYYGAEYVYNLVGSDGSQENIDTSIISDAPSRYPDGSTWQSLAAYASYQYKPNERVSLQTGLRFNNVWLDADFTENNKFFDFPFDSATVDKGALTGTAGVTWSPNASLQWRFNFATAFRAPNIDDIGKVFDSEPGSVVVPNPDLEPEYSYGGEMGLRLNFNDRVILDMATYFTYLDKAMVRRDFTINGQSEIIYKGELSNVQAIQNAARARVHGFEVGAKFVLAQMLSLTSQLSYMGGKEEQDDGSDAPLRHAAPMFGNVHLLWEHPRWLVDFFAIYNEQLRFDELAPSEVAKDYLYVPDANGNPFSPSWYTINLRGQYRFRNKLTLTIALENITDQRYRPYSSGISGPGRNFIVSLGYSF